MIPENIPGGVDGKLATQTQIGNASSSYETFEMGVYWANEVKASYSFMEYIKDKMSDIDAVIRAKANQEESDAFWSAFIMSLAGVIDQVQCANAAREGRAPWYCEESDYNKSRGK